MFLSTNALGAFLANRPASASSQDFCKLVTFWSYLVLCNCVPHASFLGVPLSRVVHPLSGCLVWFSTKIFFHVLLVCCQKLWLIRRPLVPDGSSHTKCLEYFHVAPAIDNVSSGVFHFDLFWPWESDVFGRPRTSDSHGQNKHQNTILKNSHCL